MRTLRACLRLPLLFVPIVLLFPAALSSRLLVGLGAPRLGTRLAAGVQRLWARWTLAWMGVRVERVGVVAAPRADCILIANHVSWLDILVLASGWHCCFVAKREISGWPLFGWMSRAVGTLFVARGRSRDVVEVRAQLRARLDAGVQPLLFPEGRATDGRAVRPFHAGLLEFAQQQALGSIALGLTYRVEDLDAVDSERVAWHDGTPLFEHVLRVLGYRAVVARVAGSGPHAPKPRRELARSLELEVARLAGLPLEPRLPANAAAGSP